MVSCYKICPLTYYLSKSHVYCLFYHWISNSCHWSVRSLLLILAYCPVHSHSSDLASTSVSPWCSCCYATTDGWIYAFVFMHSISATLFLLRLSYSFYVNLPTIFCVSTVSLVFQCLFYLLFRRNRINYDWHLYFYILCLDYGYNSYGDPLSLETQDCHYSSKYAIVSHIY